MQNWSKDIANHCMCLCLGPLQSKTRKNKLEKTNDELNCSYNFVSLSKDISKHNRWNGNELPKQITNGVNETVKQC